MSTLHDIPATVTNMSHWIKLIEEEETFLTQLSQYQINKLKIFVTQLIQNEKNDLAKVTVKGMKFKTLQEKFEWIGSRELEKHLEVERRLNLFLRRKSDKFKRDSEQQSTAGKISKRRPNDKNIEGAKNILKKYSVKNSSEAFIKLKNNGFKLAESDECPSESWVKKHFEKIKQNES